jgi:preprotein translocase SecF subunit
MEFFHETRVDFLKWRRVAIGVSAAFIAVGMASLVLHGGPRLGVDFRGGTELQVGFSRPVTAGEVRESLGRIGLGRAEIKQYGSPREFLVRAPDTGTADDLSRVVLGRLAEDLPDASPELRALTSVGPKVGSELRRAAAGAMLLSLVLLLVYISIRFEPVFGVGAVIALVHDVLVTLGVLSLLDREIDLTVVAAFLTLVGYSLNDTIVVLDRVRENLRGRPLGDHSIAPVINVSINQTLSRTILTGGTTLLTVGALFALGGETLRGFSLCLLIGILTGTYSSIYIAAPVIVEWYDRQRAGRRPRGRDASGSRPATPAPRREPA